nr:sensor protein CitS [Aureimonas sp. AU4]
MITKGVAKPRQPGRQGRLAQVQAPGGTCDVPFRQQGFEGDEQAEIKVLGIHLVDNSRQKVRFQHRIVRLHMEIAIKLPGHLPLKLEAGIDATIRTNASNLFEIPLSELGQPTVTALDRHHPCHSGEYHV